MIVRNEPAQTAFVGPNVFYRNARMSSKLIAPVYPCWLPGRWRGFGPGLVAERLGRNAILIALNPDDVAMAQQWIDDASRAAPNEGGRAPCPTHH
jgi:hypothetical protein